MKSKYLFFLFFYFFIQSNHSQIDANFDSDTIKNRLERLNAKTPLELFFSPDLEKTIKKYLKTRVNFYKKTSLGIYRRPSSFLNPSPMVRRGGLK